MYLLDTDIVIWILRKDQRIIESVFEYSSKKITAISVITIAEVYKNPLPSEIPIIEEFFHNQKVYNVDRDIAKQAGYYWNQFHKKFITLGIVDCLIAATARKINADLVTLNLRHFPMTDINIVNPLQPRLLKIKKPGKLRS